jgi:hypothetical protein
LIGPELGKKMGWGHYKQKMMRELPQVDPLVQLHGAAWRPQESLQKDCKGPDMPLWVLVTPNWIGNATKHKTKLNWFI